MRLDIRSYDSVTSTMDVALQAAEAGAAEGLVIVAETQTAGRGRRGRMWSSPTGTGLYLSCVLRPPLDARSGTVLSLITLGAGVAVREAIARSAGVIAQLKWPNDVMLGRRKLAGILAEGVGIGTPSQVVILGVGVNVADAAHPDDIASRATALEQERGAPVDRAALLEEILAQLDDVYGRLCGGDADDILRAWREAAPTAHGTDVEWDTEAGVFQGTTDGIDDNGALLVRTSAGVKRVIAGEVRWL